MSERHESIEGGAPAARNRGRLDHHPTWKQALIGSFSALGLVAGLGMALAECTVTRAAVLTAREGDRAVAEATRVSGEAKDFASEVRRESKDRDERLEHKLDQSLQISKDNSAALKAESDEIEKKIDKLIMLMLEQAKQKGVLK